MVWTCSWEIKEDERRATAEPYKDTAICYINGKGVRHENVKIWLTETRTYIWTKPANTPVRDQVLVAEYSASIQCLKVKGN